MGFFSDEELTQSTQITYTADGTECERCGLYQDHKHNKLEYIGKGKKGILIVLDCPTVIEARQQSLERSAKVKQLTLAAKLYGINLLEDFYVTYAVRCVPPVVNGLPVPPPLSIENCRLKLFQLIEEKQPEAIFAFGAIALKTLIGDKVNKITVDLFRGLKIPDQRHKAWLLSTYGHDYIRTRENDNNLLSVWNRDIGDMFRFIKNIPPLLDNSIITKDICTLTSFPKIIKTLDRIIERQPHQLYFDYETTGLKPHSSGHKITHVSFCTGGKGYSFPFQHRDFFSADEQKQIEERLINILTNHNIWKSAHHCKFEQMWSLGILGVYPEPWDMDTLLASHIADNRRGFTGLKFQTYIVLGIYPYDGDVAGYLSAEGGNSFNRVEEIPTKQALTYSALDSRYGYEVLKYYEELFMQEDNEGLCYAYDLFHEGNLVFADMQENGMRVDEEHYHNTKIKLKAQIEKLYKKIDESFESKEFQKKYSKYIDIDSPKELVLLFDGILKYDLPLTDKGNLSVDKEALAAINSEFTNTILEIRKLQKIVGTYIAQFERETANGVLHGSYNLNIPISYRSSASDPNMQNISVRDPIAKEACRGGLYAHKGHKLLEADYSGVEVSISACTHNDPNMITYIKDPATDMHRDTAADLFLLEEKQVTKQIRQAVKGGWVFPQFYGSWYKECGENLWKEVVLGGFKLEGGTLIAEHLKKNKIKNKEAFIKHCKKSENIFWNERFKVYAQWKKDINAEYRRKGFITTPFGFIFRGYMQEKDVTNYPIQSTAFHCLLWSLIRINKYLKKNDFKSKVLGQIHDSIIISVAPEEQDKVITVVNYIGTTLLQDAHPFITVPMKIDFEIPGVDKPWSTKKEIELTARHKLLERLLLFNNETPYLQTKSIWEEEEDD